jgi:O-antigen ligase
MKSKAQISKKFLYISSVVLVGLILIAVALLKSNNTIQDIIFHTSKSSTVKTTSNGVRLYALRTNTSDVVHHPLGEGVGSAGPASTHNDKPAKIAENFYVQIAQETGILGLFIFLLINIIVAYRLYINRKDQLSLVLLATLIGITIINLVSHAWADDTLSLLWWGFAGVALSPKLSKSEVTIQ